MICRNDRRNSLGIFIINCRRNYQGIPIKTAKGVPHTVDLRTPEETVAEVSLVCQTNFRRKKFHGIVEEIPFKKSRNIQKNRMRNFRNLQELLEELHQ